MFATTKSKWLLSIILAGILLALSLSGSKWGRIYAAQASVNAAPVIHFIAPIAVPAGSPDRVLIIDGANFGTDAGCIAIWLKDLQNDYIEYPQVVIDDGISVIIHANLLVNPNRYLLAVVKGTCYSIPTVPPDPQWDLVSTPVDFTVYAPIYGYLPIMEK